VTGDRERPHTLVHRSLGEGVKAQRRQSH